ncbi:universal stress protein [Nocardia arthritidis]|uniref:universal stress protein n=1 Tax=Nocardia arthritidis TaxID=228602 RepID=UPI0007A4FA96|nr:universal stress protein [Nocardia arthritidis]
MSANTNPPIVVGVDGSPVALAALRWASVDAARHHVPLHLLHAIGVLGDFGSGFELGQFDFDSYRRGGLDALETARAIGVAESAPIAEVDIGTELVEAYPIPVLSDRSQTARLLVVGTHGLGALNRRLLGSVGPIKDSSTVPTALQDGSWPTRGPGDDHRHFGRVQDGLPAHRHKEARALSPRLNGQFPYNVDVRRATVEV